MGKIILCLGDSGSGKTSALRNFKKGEVAIFNPAGKPLPFITNLDVANRPSYNQTLAALKANNFNCYVIDDAGYYMAFDNFKFAKVKGYEKFVTMASNFEELLEVAMDTSDDTLIYFNMHIEIDEHSGKPKPKICGKMIETAFGELQGLFTFCFVFENHDGEYRIITSGKLNPLVKAGFNIFDDDTLPNDLKLIDTKLREAYGLAPLGTRPKKAVSTAPGR